MCEYIAQLFGRCSVKQQEREHIAQLFGRCSVKQQEWESNAQLQTEDCSCLLAHTGKKRARICKHVVINYSENTQFCLGDARGHTG
jgi:hypothetical protein